MTWSCGPPSPRARSHHPGRTPASCCGGVDETYADGDGSPGLYLRGDGVEPGDTDNDNRVWNGGRWLSRGAGTTFLVGLVRRWELEAGEIHHALAFAHDYPNSHHVYPASKSDGLGNAEDEVDSDEKLEPPEGARLRLKDSFDIDAMSDEHGKTIARALRDYGTIVIDNSGRPKVYPEAEETAGWDGEVTESTVAEIGLDQFEVVDWDAEIDP